MDGKIAQLTNIIRRSDNIVFFGGAGVSTESGIPDFRSSDGIFMQNYKYAPEQIVSHSFFIGHTEDFYEFYKTQMMYLDATPNQAHKRLAEWEACGKVKAVVTQNIDGLHQVAGSKNVLELHGSIHRNYCKRCGKFYDASYVKQYDGIPRCECGSVIKPDVVLYEEGLHTNVIEQAVTAIAQADTLIIGGTSLAVYPAAGFIDYFHGTSLVVINVGETAKDAGANLYIREPIAEVFGQIEL